MMQNKQAIIVIPSRLAATRLPNKPLLDINGLPMILQVINRAMEADIADILIATADEEILELVQDYGHRAILTEPTLPSGSDRINVAIEEFDKAEKYDTIINLQGDLPTIDKKSITTCYNLLKNKSYGMSSIVAKINNEDDKINPNVVKAIIAFKNEQQSEGEALYFTRASAPWGKGEMYHHIGIYGYKREILRKFTSLKPSLLEQREKLEQLRALENGIKIGVAVVDTIPIGVDTKEDLKKASDFLKQAKQSLT